MRSPSTPRAPASYTVSLTVTDGDGNTASTSVTIPYAGASGGGSLSPFQADEPTVSLEECDVNGTPDSSAVPAGSPAYFQVSVGGYMPAKGTVNVFYNTQDGTDVGKTDYTASGDQELTFNYDPKANGGNGGYDPQIISVKTSPDADPGTFSMLVPYLYDSCIPQPAGPMN